jgi:cystathionine beta-synthase
MVTDGEPAEPDERATPRSAIADSPLDLIGDTPLVRLGRVGAGLAADIVAKVEFTNPGGSIKDRIAVEMVDDAMAKGLLGPGGTIVEPTSGNTGLGLAIVAARHGLRCIFTMPDKMSMEKVQALRAFGAEVVVCPTAVAPADPRSYYSVANRITEETPGAFQPNQYHNPANPAAHEATTGPEIWRQTDGRITHLVVGIGTGGTISGVGRYVKSQNPDVRVVGADPEGSVYSGGDGRPYLVEGVGEDFWPETLDKDVVDEVISISDAESFATAREVTKLEGLWVGGSSGLAIAAARRLAQRLERDGEADGALIVVIVPDGGRPYLSKVYDDTWMASHGFPLELAEPIGAGADASPSLTAAELLHRHPAAVPELVSVAPDAFVSDAVALLEQYGISRLPVVKEFEGELPAAAVVGAVSEQGLLRTLARDPAAAHKPVQDIMEDPLPFVGASQPLDELRDVVTECGAVIVLDGGHPIGVLTRADVLDALAR